MRCSLLFLANIFFVLLTSPIYARVICVPIDSATIQGGIDGAVDGDTVMIYQGTYHENLFIEKAITVMGTDPLDSVIVATTVVDGDSSWCVVHFPFGVDSLTVLSGLTITGGYDDGGGGIQCVYSSPKILNNIIMGNSTERHENGGGISCMYASPTISDNIIVGNMADWEGGGIYCYSSSPRIMNNIITGNSATAKGGGLFCGFDDPTDMPTIANNIIKDNSVLGNASENGGGGIACQSSSPIIMNNVIVGNFSTYYGGGVFLYQSAYPTLTNNIIALNEAVYGGGGFACRSYSTSSILLSGNTLAGNSSLDGGAVWCEDDASLIMTNSIMWGNDAETGPEIWMGSSSWPSTLTISYSDLDGGEAQMYIEKGCIVYWGPGMIDADPSFTTFRGFEYLLYPGSPCIDSADPVLEDGFDWPAWYSNGIRADMGAYGGPGNVNWLY